MKIKRDQVIQIYQTLSAFSSEKLSPKGAYKVYRNRSIAENEVRAVEEYRKQSTSPKEFIEFEHKRLELCAKLANKDEDGNPKKIAIPYPNGIEQEVYDIPIKNQPILEKQVTELAEGEYKEAIVENNKLLSELNSFMNEELDISFIKFVLDDLPEKITPDQITILEGILEMSD